MAGRVEQGVLLFSAEIEVCLGRQLIERRGAGEFPEHPADLA